MTAALLMGSMPVTASSGAGTVTQLEKKNGRTGTVSQNTSGNSQAGTQTPDGSQTGTGTQTPDDSQTGTGTQTPDDSQTGTGTQTPDGSQTGTGTQTPDDSQTGTGTQTPDDSQTGTGTQTPDDSQTGTGTQTPDDSQTGTGTQTPGNNNQNSTSSDQQSGSSTNKTETTTGNVVRVTIDGTSTEYTNLKEAWAAVSGRTARITLTGNVTTRSPETVCSLSSGNVTLDLNGHTWSYQSMSDQSDAIPPDLLTIGGDASLTIEGTGTMSYIGNGDYSGACVYVKDSASVTIQNGTFSSNASAPVYVEGASLTVTGGTFRAADSDSNAISVTNGTYRMTGGEVALGNLVLSNTNGSQSVSIGGTSRLSGLVTKGSHALTIRETLAKGYGYQKIGKARSNSSGGTWISDEETLSGNQVSSVRTAAKAIKSVSLTADNDPAPKTYEFDFTYGDTGNTVTLNVSHEMEDGETAVPVYEWYCVYNSEGTPQKVQADAGTPDTLTFSTGKDASGKYTQAGTYEYYAKALVSGTGEEAVSQKVTITVKPLSGTITNKTDGSGYQTEYTYGDSLNVPGDMVNRVDFSGASIPDDVKNRLAWTQEWYRDSVTEENKVPESEIGDAGTYVLQLTASDASNYSASGTVTVTINKKEVTPRIEGPNTKEYDGTTDAKGAKILLDGILSADESRVSIDQDQLSFGYNDANVAQANEIRASGIALTGEKATNYTLALTDLSIPATITKVRLTVQISPSPATQRVNQPVTVTVTVTASSSGDTSMDSYGLKAEDITLSVSGRNDNEDKHALALTAVSGKPGVFTSQYTTGIKGDKTFTAEVADQNGNYDLNVISANMTVVNTIATSTTITADETEDIVYGDEVTYTIIVTKENVYDTNSFGGTVQLYRDSVADANKIGSAKSVISSGEKVKIKLDEEVLTAGNHKIIAQFWPKSGYLASSAEISTSVAKKKLTWDVSGLSASKQQGVSGEVTVYGTLKLDGLIDEDDVEIKQPDVMKTNGFKSANAGSYKVTVEPEDGEWEFDPEDPKNYELPEGEPTITAKVNALKELDNPPADAEGKKFKLMMEEGLSATPDGLKGTAFNTPVKVEQELKRILTSSGIYKETNFAVYDVILQVSSDEGTTWQNADYHNFPSGGLTVTLPYPAGTGRYTNNFAVAHMFTTSYFGKTSGTVEIPKVRKTDNGLEFKVTGLSPIAIAWTDSTATGGGGLGAVGTSVMNAIGAVTGDASPIVLYGSLAGGAVLVLFVIAGIGILDRKKRKKHVR